MNTYPFTKCLNPRRIINRYTREVLVVECGYCSACLMRKSSLNAMKVRLESLSHKYNMFITLTYNNISLPRMTIEAVNRFKDNESGDVIDTNEQFNVYDITTRLGTQGTFLGKTPDYYWFTEVLSKKCEITKGILPHLSKYDTQLFIKRLRNNLDKYWLKKYGSKAPKIRYYLVGEYGPRHFRPHYHVILWFEDEEIYKVIRQILYKSWPYGRIDCQKSLGKCSDYVAKYVTCNMSLPEVFTFQQTRPFAIHSTHLGEKVLEITREEIYENEFESVVRRSIPCYSTTSDVFLWRSLKTFYFPKCKGFSTFSERERLYAYSTYVTSYRWTGETCVAKQARIITFTLLNRFYGMDLADDMYVYDDKLLDYFEKSSMFDPWNFENKRFEDHIDDVYRRIYMELRLSKHFHRFVCKGFVNNYKPMITKIENFWKDNDSFNLKNQLISQGEFVLSEFYDNEEDFQYYYHNLGFDFEQFKQTNAYKKYEMITTTNSAYAIKHKELNDANRIFMN